jgi:hypothetical protein
MRGNEPRSPGSTTDFGPYRIHQLLGRAVTVWCTAPNAVLARVPDYGRPSGRAQNVRFAAPRGDATGHSGGPHRGGTGEPEPETSTRVPLAERIGSLLVWPPPQPNGAGRFSRRRRLPRNAMPQFLSPESGGTSSHPVPELRSGTGRGSWASTCAATSSTPGLHVRSTYPLPPRHRVAWPRRWRRPGHGPQLNRMHRHGWRQAAYRKQPEVVA